MTAALGLLPAGYDEARSTNDFRSTKTSQFCPQGHDKDEVGRSKRGACKRCLTIKARVERKRDFVKSDRQNDAFSPWLPWAAMGRALRERGVTISSFDSNTKRSLSRAKATGRISVPFADDVLCSIGIHPALVFGWDFYAPRLTSEERKRLLYVEWWHIALGGTAAQMFTEEGISA